MFDHKFIEKFIDKACDLHIEFVKKGTREDGSNPTLYIIKDNWYEAYPLYTDNENDKSSMQVATDIIHESSPDFYLILTELNMVDEDKVDYKTYETLRKHPDNKEHFLMYGKSKDGTVNISENWEIVRHKDGRVKKLKKSKVEVYSEVIP